MPKKSNSYLTPSFIFSSKKNRVFSLKEWVFGRKMFVRICPVLKRARNGREQLYLMIRQPFLYLLSVENEKDQLRSWDEVHWWWIMETMKIAHLFRMSRKKFLLSTSIGFRVVSSRAWISKAYGSHLMVLPGIWQGGLPHLRKKSCLIFCSFIDDFRDLILKKCHLRVFPNGCLCKSFSISKIILKLEMCFMPHFKHFEGICPFFPIISSMSHQRTVPI